MKAVACENTELELVDLPTPEPAEGQVLVKVLRCGICGSDLHARHHADQAADVLAEAGYDGFMRSDQRVVFGHEFCGEVADYGLKTRRKVATGTPVVALPLLRRAGGVEAIGLSAAAPGAYAEQVLVEESLMFALPDGVAPELGVLTEPMAIGWHAVRRAEVKKGDVAIVIGCGPVGLAVICMLKVQGVRTIVASDFSRGRRELASACGADVVVDPSEDSPYEGSGDHGHLKTVPDAAEAALETIEKLERLPLPWHHVWRVAERLGAKPKRPVIFECVGVPGILDGVISGAPLFSRRRGRGLHGAGQDPPGDGDQQGDRPALRRRLHAAGVPRHPADARRGQGERRPDRDRDSRPVRCRGGLRRARGPRDSREDIDRPRKLRRDDLGQRLEPHLLAEDLLHEVRAWHWGARRRDKDEAAHRLAV